MDLLAKIVKGSQPLTVFAKSSILDVWMASEYASASIWSWWFLNFAQKHIKDNIHNENENIHILQLY